MTEQIKQVDTTSDVKVKKTGIGERYKVLWEQHNHVKSPVIRALSADGYDRGQIAAVMGIRYQHVRNVLITPLTGKK